MKQKLWLWLFCLCALPAFAQTPAGVSGKVIDELTGDPIAGVMVVLRENNQTAYTGEDGAFVFHPVTHGKDVLSLNAADIQSKEIPVDIPRESSLDLGIIQVTRRPMPVQQLAGVIDEAQRATEDDDTGLSQDVSAMVIFSNDVFLQNAGYQFSQFRFRS
ncbi:MAG TPA: TonB-dependent receptor, partial [Porphyromonadaceae bacterium]|nr:TonB-dependent receptor [Porphyromonadaceae bacterium]